MAKTSNQPFPIQLTTGRGLEKVANALFQLLVFASMGGWWDGLRCVICVLDHGAGRGRQGERYDAVAFVQNFFFFLLCVLLLGCAVLLHANMNALPSSWPHG